MNEIFLPLQSKLLNSTFTDTGAGHNIIVPESVAEAYYSQVPGTFLDVQLGPNSTLWYVYISPLNIFT